MERLTDLRIRSLKAPERGQVTYLDAELTGFGVRVSQGGTKTFVLTYGADRRRVTLGRYPVLSLADAREKAKDKLAQIQLGADHKPIPYKDLKERFLADTKRHVRERTYDSYEWLLGRVDLTGDANAITTRTLTDKTKDLAPSVRQHVLAVFKIMFRWAVNEGLLKTSPADPISVRKSKGRKRVLTDDELRKVWHACPSTAYGNVVRLLILTGQRREEVSHFVLTDDLVTIDGQYTKNHRDHVFPVTGITVDLIGKDRTWGGWSKSKKELDKASGVTAWTLHDLRRTFRTAWGRLRLPREVAEKYINHVSGVQTPVEQVYDQHDYLPEMREAIKVYTDHVMEVVAPKPHLVAVAA
jgi:integrase